jgi:hypothetical protein
MKNNMIMLDSSSLKAIQLSKQEDQTNNVLFFVDSKLQETFALNYEAKRDYPTVYSRQPIKGATNEYLVSAPQYMCNVIYGTLISPSLYQPREPYPCNDVNSILHSKEILILIGST